MTGKSHRLGWPLVAVISFMGACAPLETGRPLPSDAASGVTGLPTSTTEPSIEDLPPAQPPPTAGADPALDELARACFEGDLAACDGLLIVSEPGSTYEEYAATCGGRTDTPLGSCVDVFGPAFSLDTSSKTGDAVGIPSGLLVAVRMAAHQGFDRFVLEFQSGGIPGFEVRYLDEQSIGVSGDPLPLEGIALISIVVAPVFVTAENQPTNYTGPVRLHGATGNIIEAALVGVNGGGIEWVLSLQRRTGFEVFTLGEPPRLVIDVSQD